MSIAGELIKLNNTKNAIKTAIVGKGVSVSDSDTFASYATKINSIETGSTDTDAELTTLRNAAKRTVTSISNNKATSLGEAVLRYCTSLTSVTFDNVLTIGKNALTYCTALKTASFPEAVEIGVNAFGSGSASYSCKSMTSLNIPKVATIANGGLMYCTSLSSLSTPSVVDIGANAFVGDSKITSLSFPVLSSIASGAFSNCSALKSLTISNTSVCALANSNAFNGTPIASGTGYIYVPSNLVDIYKSATNWSTYANQIRSM